MANKLPGLLTCLLQASYDKGILPDCWKTARVQPISKKGSKAMLSNYRLISLLLIKSKVMESIIDLEIFKYLESNKLIHDRSTVSATKDPPEGFLHLSPIPGVDP